MPTPDATVAFSKDAALEALDSQGYPRVIKPTVGSWGRLISKLNDRDAAEGIIESREKDVSNLPSSLFRRVCTKTTKRH